MSSIATDIIDAGIDKRWPDGALSVNGVVIGFMDVIGTAVAHSRVLDRL
jgi:hypothetical protein